MNSEPVSVCRHGGLRMKCELCNLEDEVAELQESLLSANAFQMDSWEQMVNEESK